MPTLFPTPTAIELSRKARRTAAELDADVVLQKIARQVLDEDPDEDGNWLADLPKEIEPNSAGMAYLFREITKGGCMCAYDCSSCGPGEYQHRLRIWHNHATLA